MNDWRPGAEVNHLSTLTGLPGVVVGEIVGVTPDDQPIVSWDGRQNQASATVAWFADPPSWAKCYGLRVILVFEGGDAAKPILLGLLDSPPTTPVRKPKTLRVESEKELVIECGKAKIALRADGRIEIRGGHLISRATGPNKIKGGSVHIN